AEREGSGAACRLSRGPVPAQGRDIRPARDRGPAVTGRWRGDRVAVAALRGGERRGVRRAAVLSRLGRPRDETAGARPTGRARAGALPADARPGVAARAAG